MHQKVHGQSGHNKMKMKNTNKIIGVLIVAAVLLINSVFAFGVGSAYHSDYPLELPSGGTQEITFNIQNIVGSENIEATASIEKGSEIMEIIDKKEIYPIPVGSELDIKARVTIPEDAKAGDVYPVTITFTNMPTAGSGAFFGASVSRSFNVVVILSAEEKAQIEKQRQILTYLVIGIIILIILVIAVVLLKRRKTNTIQKKKLINFK